MIELNSINGADFNNIDAKIIGEFELEKLIRQIEKEQNEQLKGALNSALDNLELIDNSCYQIIVKNKKIVSIKTIQEIK